MARLATNLLTRDLARSTAFYTQIASLSVLRQGEVYAVLGTAEEKTLELVLIDWVSQLIPRAARGVAEGAFLTLVIEDVAAALAEARRFDVEIIETTPAGAADPVHAVIRDIDGRVLELVTPAAHLVVEPEETAT